MQKFAQSEALITQWQQYLKQSPLGISYSGGSPGVMDNNLRNALQNLEAVLQGVANETVIGKIIVGNSILVGPEFAKNLISKEQHKKVEETKKVTPGAGYSNTNSESQILAFKQYLSTNGLYHGDVKSPEADPEFVGAIQRLEKAITIALQKINPSAMSLNGVIWVGDHLNPDTSPEDIDNAIKTIEQYKVKKQAQATVDTFDVEEYQTQQPIAFKPNPTQDDFSIETNNPETSQQIGKSRAEIPANMSKTPPNLKQKKTMDERVFGLSELLSRLPE